MKSFMLMCMSILVLIQLSSSISLLNKLKSRMSLATRSHLSLTNGLHLQTRSH